MGDWRALSELTVPLAAGEPVYADVESWQVLGPLTVSCALT